MKKLQKENIRAVLIQGLIGAISGFSFVYIISRYDSLLFSGFWINTAVLLILFILVYFIELIMHETGHLIFGIISGYQFLSFRILDFVIIKADNKIKFKKMKLANTLGQCLLIPPPYSEDYPFVLYNLGGIAVNVISGLIGLLIFLQIKMPIISLIGYLFFTSGMLQALSNGVPMKVEAVANDGYNIRYFNNNPAAKRAFHLQLDINAKQTNGIRLKDMNPEIFAIEDDEMCLVSMLKENYLMDAHKFKEAETLAKELVKNNKMIELYKVFLQFDIYTCNTLLNEERDDSIFKDKQVKNIIKMMPDHPSIIRTLIAKNGYDEGILKRMSKHPIEVEIESEIEIINLLKDKC